MAKEFGSRADMISAKIDEVSRNSIWREHTKKELANHTLNTNFNIADLRKMMTIPEKPNHVKPDVKMSEEDIAFATRTLKEVCSVKNRDLLPVDKYESPVTSAQENGWHARIMLVKKNPMFDQARNSCDVTQYADAYYSMTGTTPFSRKDKGSI